MERLALFLVIATMTEARMWTSDVYPRVSDKDNCGHKSLDDTNVMPLLCDPDRMLTDAQAKRISRRLEEIMRGTVSPCSAESKRQSGKEGFSVGVALLDGMSLPQEYNEYQIHELFKTRLDEASKFSHRVLHNSHLGECGEDVLVFYSKEDQMLYTMTGDKSDDRLTPTLITEITLEHRKYFAAGDYETGLSYLLEDYKRALNGDYKSTIPAGKPQAAGLIQLSSDASKTFWCVVTTGLLAFFTFLLH